VQSIACPFEPWEPSPDIGCDSAPRFQVFEPPHIYADLSLTGRLGRWPPGIRNLPICIRQSEPQCIGQYPRAGFPLPNMFGDRQCKSMFVWSMMPNADERPPLWDHRQATKSPEDRPVSTPRRITVRRCKRRGPLAAGLLRKIRGPLNAVMPVMPAMPRVVSVATNRGCRDVTLHPLFSAVPQLPWFNTAGKGTIRGKACPS
jgi:hypothetical protein